MSAIRVAFITSEGTRVEAAAEPGASLLEVGQAAGMPLEGTCEAQMACSTCHVILPPEWFDKLPPAVEDEEDMTSSASLTSPLPHRWTRVRASSAHSADVYEAFQCATGELRSVEAS